MDNKNSTLTTSNIRYLIALNALDREAGIRCVDIAAALKLSKPSVHEMMKALHKKGLVDMAQRGMVFLTQEGRALAQQYAAYSDVACSFLRRGLALSPADSVNAACALLAEISGEGIERMCEKMQNIL